ncbi:MAG: Asp-tRNA(Asn)/Glu-tRNA(Gln) amidotransferase subunit GatC [Rhodospirillales bacterium]|nr:Asp-tRNA(Asn)/Glu-tRNA(Gln) amidotransferase subunit GatC [Rhodospirillales bacterium]MCB9965259.1 Asp-tRNA(Asn)/Glu-tRNA(Gln) amidotransferase subunit GatC [Rhodospirillales bacterium]MCB9972971.1 Asp-tRNA(Asn)/Glu-tRNA(Gln) amidotransferase subunit GatC [Rhodospirillales bacterium]MCB9980041.1 Asp-tRNA(Asn)/Glu-tRNA(Gln) amidotransferase subunit GatC [Rhodospirillales bacterium]
MDEKTIKKIAHLARMSLRDESEVQQRLRESTGILSFIEQLQEVDTTGIVPLANPNDDIQRLRKDEVMTGEIGNAGSAHVLANAPEQNSGYFVVPKIVE